MSERNAACQTLANLLLSILHYVQRTAMMDCGTVCRTPALAITIALSMAACGGGSGSGGPPTTISLRATADTPAQVSLSWSAPSDQTQFDLYRNGEAVYDTHLTGHSVTAYTLEPATRYCYQLNAIEFPLGVVGTSNTACVTTPALAGWPVSVIDGGPAQWLAMAIDAGGATHLSVRGGNGLAYWTNASGAWSKTVVDATAGSVGQTAIAVDALHAVHISYYDATRGALAYATNRSGGWASATVAVAGGYHNAIALDAGGLPHVAYSGDPNAGGPLMHASRTSGSWSSEFVTAGAVQRVSIAVAGTVLHAAAAVGDGIHCALLHEVNGLGTWAESVVASSATCSAAMALDSSGAVHLTYTTRSPDFTLQYASNASGVWMTTEVDRFYWIPGDLPSIATDAIGRAHIGYTDHSGLLKHADNTSGAWRRVWLDTHAFGTAVGVGGDGRARLAYDAADAGGSSRMLRYTVSP